MADRSLLWASSIRQRGSLLDSNVLPAPSSEDANSTSFFTATGITDATIKLAINQLVYRLKYYGLWAKIKACYPIVGGSATTHMYNLKDPQNTNGAFRLNFSGGWTHSGNGMESNGTSAYADTYVNVSSSITAYATSHHLAIYSRTSNPTNNAWVMGVGNTSTGNPLWGLAFRPTPYGDISNIILYDAGNATSPTVTGRGVASITDRTGFVVASTTSSTNHNLYHRNHRVINNTQTTTGSATNANMYIGAINASPAGSVFYQGMQFAFVSIGDGLTDDECVNMRKIVDAFQTTLGRAI